MPLSRTETEILRTKLSALVDEYEDEVAVMLDWIYASRKPLEEVKPVKIGNGLRGAYARLRVGMTWDELVEELQQAHRFIIENGIEKQRARNRPSTLAYLFKRTYRDVLKRRDRHGGSNKIKYKNARYATAAGWPFDAVEALEEFGLRSPPPRIKRKKRTTYRREGDEELPSIEDLEAEVE